MGTSRWWRNETVSPIAVGAIAHRALSRAGGVARVLARLSESTYLTAGDEVVWLGAAGAVLHPRAILVARPPDIHGDEVRVEAGGLTPWSPPAIRLDTTARIGLGHAWRRLTADIAVLGAPAGFGALLAGRPLDFPLASVRDVAEALAEACARDDVPAAAHASVALLGVGGGLTPSGDDYVGGALFARRLLATSRLVDAVAWNRAAAIVLAAAPVRTHAISVALLGDLAAGLGWAPLHDLIAALAAGVPDDARVAARCLVSLGHSSGWDLLAGLGAGLGALRD